MDPETAVRFATCRLMCGIAGLSLAHPRPPAAEVMERMVELLRHRGPSSGGVFASPDKTNWLGFRRLAIRDLEARANQPMLSMSARTAIIFNGEIYNTQQLVDCYLSKHPFRTTGDTEVVLELLEEYGLEVIPELNGMFALAFLDIASGVIWLARDRMGKKPLYLFEADSTVAFASELRALKPFGLRTDPQQADWFLHFGYFPSPHTFFKQTSQVCPGEIVKLHAGRVQARRRYHRFTDLVWGQREPDHRELESLLADATRLRTLSDVPRGAFLSGGVDSALVCAQLAQQDKLPAFTVAFQDEAHDEAASAATTAAELGVPHQIIDIPQSDLPVLAADYLDCYEQPYADTSGLATMLLCRAVKQHVTVALSGDGGDEFFGGYARYRWFAKFLKLQHVPLFARRAMGVCLSRMYSRRGSRLSTWLNANDPARLYAEILRNWTATRPTQLVPELRDETRPVDLVADTFRQLHGADALSRAACFDASYYIPDDLQVKLDRASMAVALEVRCPLLDFRVAEAGAALRTDAKFRGGSKAVLKQLLQHHVSPSITQRPKRGFSVPLGRWLAGPLRSYVQETLRARKVRELGWIRAETAEKIWREFLTGKTWNAHCIWMFLTLIHHGADTKADSRFRALLSPASQRAA